MKGAPGFKQYPDFVHQAWKYSFLRYLQKQTGIEVLLETGTHAGGMSKALSRFFKQVYTIELSDHFYNWSKMMLAGCKNIKQYHGSSRLLLYSILQDIPQTSMIFWLDAHYSGGLTAHDGDPLEEELKAIMSLCPDPLIAIDDMPGVDLNVNIDFYGWTREYRTGIVLMYRNGRFSIPEFE